MSTDGSIRCFTELKKEMFKEEKVKTTTSKDQVCIFFICSNSSLERIANLYPINIGIISFYFK